MTEEMRDYYDGNVEIQDATGKFIKRWIVVRRGIIAIFKDEASGECSDLIDLVGCHVKRFKKHHLLPTISEENQETPQSNPWKTARSSEENVEASPSLRVKLRQTFTIEEKEKEVFADSLGGSPLTQVDSEGEEDREEREVEGEDDEGMDSSGGETKKEMKKREMRKETEEGEIVEGKREEEEQNESKKVKVWKSWKKKKKRRGRRIGKSS